MAKQARSVRRMHAKAIIATRIDWRQGGPHRLRVWSVWSIGAGAIAFALLATASQRAAVPRGRLAKSA